MSCNKLFSGFFGVRQLYRTSLGVLVIAPAYLSAACAPVSAVDFSREIRPILSDRCFKCHGPDDAAREGELRLDVRETAVQSAIIPGDAEASEFFRRIITSDPEDQMPPVESQRPRLDAKQIALVRAWIEEGAQFDRHWSLRLPGHGEPPQVEGADVRNPIDRFLLARLREEGYAPSPAADPRTLIRRLSFDLVGLPPTPDQVEQFVADPSAGAYSNLADRFLGSPHYGERMAMYWLDVVRYADSNGLHGDQFRPHSSYRDWVIKAFNDNLPYDQFVLEQLAGDLLPDSGFEQQIASGFNRLNMTTQEGGAQPKEYRAIYQADRVRNSSAIFLGLTMGCAQCHDHKFDPLTMRDFYSWGAFFSDIEEVAVGAQQSTMMRQVRHHPEQSWMDNRIAELQQVLATQTPELAAAQLAWEKNPEKTLDDWTLLKPVSQASQAGFRLVAEDDNSIHLAEGESPKRDQYTIQFKSDLSSITALYLEVLPDALSPGGGPGRSSNGNFVLNEFEVVVDGQPTQLQGATATFSQTHYSVEAAIDGDIGSGWAILPRVNQAHHAVFELASLPDRPGPRVIQVVMKQTYGDAHVAGRFRLWATDSPRPLDANKTVLVQSVARTLSKSAAERTSAQNAELSAYFRTVAPALASTHKELSALLERQKKIGGPQRAILVSRRLETPREVRILPRGNWLDETGEVVQPAIPAIFGALDVEGRRATRLDLARWLADAENPLTARVHVNRLWKIVFGRALVHPPDDFGAQGNVPLHPELLDWLATQFVQSGWDTKKLLKLLVTSAAYQRSSLGAAIVRQRDPENDFYARQNRFRLDAEMVRDNALAISGLLNPNLGGISVKPYQPAGYWAHLNFPVRTYEHDTDGNQYRRGLYTYWCRTFLHPSLAAFDAPSREECTVERPRSNTPLAALALLNDPTYVEAARALAGRMMAGVEHTPTGRIELAYRLALQRAPRLEEIELLLELFDRQLHDYSLRTKDAEKAQAVGLSPSRGESSPEKAAWVAVARTILNLHETITRN
ncbi:MAG: PSD1 and planctomycete cytochrome C domain-containing protein [Pirellulales bacterium]|nr:PSD1 and planctomycete cytochrome C domain-containing protein [Pirellulales bacterium]